MKNLLKRGLALAMVLAMVLSFVPANVLAAEESPALPTATITPAEEPGYTYAMHVQCNPTEDQKTAYGSWKAEYELRFNKEITLNADQSADGFVSIKNEAVGIGEWTSAPQISMTLPAGEKLGIMSYVLTNPETYFNYAYVWFYDFQLGVNLDPEFLAANPDLQVVLELKLYDPETNEPVVISSYTYGAPDLPTATITNLDKEDLTFGLNFRVNEITDEQLAYYGNWYADFELTVNKDVTFNANGTADGYLAGEYGSYGWVNAPISDVELKAGQSLKIMDYAAVLMNKPGLKYTFREVYEAVQNFNCGVFFEDAFLAANPDLQVTLELKMYNPTNEGESYQVGPTQSFTVPEAPKLPTATATVIEHDDLTYAMNFAVNTITDRQLAYYGNWYADFELTVSKDMTFNANGTADGYLAGKYGSYGWVNAPISDVELKAGQSLKIMDYAAALMGEPGLKYTFREVYEAVQNFNCGVFIEPQFLLDNPDLVVTLELRMYNPANEEETYTIGDNHVFTVAQAPELPTATATDLEKEDLTFAMNFKADEATAAQLAYYGKWYADFELTVNKDVTFDANGTADGWLAGQYDGEWETWHGEWMNVPFRPVTLQANEPLRIMAFAAETLGEPGLKYTYKEVYEVVKDFNCGVYFTPEFLAANPDLKVTLELKTYNRGDETINHVIGNPYIFENNYVAYNVQTEKLYTTVAGALSEAVSGETVRLIKDTTEMVVGVLEGVTLDLNGHKLETSYLFATSDVVDDSEANTGVLKITNKKFFMVQLDNRQLPVWTAEGYKFFQIRKIADASRVNTTKDSIRYMFQPFFEGPAHESLLAGQATTGVTVRVRVSWTRADGTVANQDFTFPDSLVNRVLNSYKPQTTGYGEMFTLDLNGVSNYPGLTYQAYVISDRGVEFTVASTVKQETNLNANGASAVVAEGTKVTGNLTLKVTDLDETASNITVEEGESLKVMDVHVDGVAADNTVPVLVTVEGMAKPGLNDGNLKLYHQEKSGDVLMTQVATLAEVDAHNEFYYDPATGNITMALASFSTFTTRMVDENAWTGVYNYDWYDPEKTELCIANADQLAGFSAIVGGMNGKTPDTFKDKTVKLINDIYIQDFNSENGIMFYPIGYYNTTNSYVKIDQVEVTSGFNNFEGVFDGNGHKVIGFYQNTWEAFGDYNDGYSGTPNNYRDGFGLFGRVYRGIVKNLIVENFSSDGEFTTTGTIAAYAEGAQFENISIFNCNPRVYNIGNGGIVGCIGWYAKDADLKTKFTNITVDNTNKISALWGSWDVACGGIVGQYYPTSGQSNAGNPKNGGVEFENCHISAQIDVYNDVCANYQYYAYRYAGILMGSVRENVVANGHSYPDMSGITAKNCTVHFGDWNDYYYCELVSNTLASYTHDHQMSRLTQVEKMDVEARKYLPLGEKDVEENWVSIPSEGRYNFVFVLDKNDKGVWNHGDGHDYADCFHFVNGEVWNHEDAGYEEKDIDGDGKIDSDVLKEDKQCIYREFNNLVTGYGWGVTSKGVDDMNGVVVLDRENPVSIEKFTGKDVQTVYVSETYTIGELFEALTTEVAVKDQAVSVFVSPLYDGGTASGTHNKENITSWTEGTLNFKGHGEAVVTIMDYYFCVPTTIIVNVIDDTPVEEEEGDVEIPFAPPADDEP